MENSLLEANSNHLNLFFRKILHFTSFSTYEILQAATIQHLQNQLQTERLNSKIIGVWWSSRFLTLFFPIFWLIMVARLHLLKIYN